MDYKDKAILHEAIMYHGARRQIIKAVEEMAELQKELCKSLAALYSDDCVMPVEQEKVAEEMADVAIMMEQLEIIFMCSGMKEAVMRQKLERLHKSITEGEG